MFVQGNQQPTVTKETVIRVLITGAAGNLGTLLARHIRDRAPDIKLILMQHRTPVARDLQNCKGIAVRSADLADPRTLPACLSGAGVIVHFVGVLFKARPAQFLPRTNLQYFRHLVQAAQLVGIDRVILISFPHVEGPTTPDRPACGRLDGSPVSVHARTRLAEEQYLFSRIPTAVSLRVGMVYGHGILMIDAARWLARRRLLGVWKSPTPIHLIAKTDFCRGVVAALRKPSAKGIYHLGDTGCDTLQSFLDLACDHWHCRRPWRMPLGLIYLAAALCESVSLVFRTASPLTRDFIDIGRVSYHGDTTRFRQELLPALRYPTFQTGIAELNP